MAVNWGNWLDEYDREARLVPALLVLLPLVLVVIGLGFEKNYIVVSVLGVLMAIGTPMIVAKQVGDLGRAAEATLNERWGGPPTALMLIPPADQPMGERLRQRRSRLGQLSGTVLPAGTSVSPADIDTYQTAVRWLIEHTRDHSRFPVVWTELKNYGFDRNTFGVRAFGLATSVIGTVVLLSAAIAGACGARTSVAATAVLAVACTGVGVWWYRVPSEARVRRAADRYAERLLDASALLS